MSQLQPSIWMEFRLEEYPTATTTTYKWSTRPLADSNSFKEGRVVAWGDVDRSLSSITGDYEVSRTTVVLDDSDGLFRGLLGGATTKYFLNREAAIKLLSEAGRAAGVPPRLLFRGRINEYQLQVGRKAILSITDLVGSRLSGFDLDKTIPSALLGDEHTNIKVLPSTKESFGHVYPIYAGEHSDNGALDANGVAADKGMCPVFDTGDYDITGSTAPPVYAAPPVITNSGVVGTTGEKTYYYAATVVTPYGESALSNIVALSGASGRDLSNYNWIEGTYDNGGASPYNTVRILRSDTTTFSQWLDEANYFAPSGNFGYADGAAPVSGAGGTGVTRNELDVPKAWPGSTVGGALSSDTVWGRLVVAIGTYEIIGIYGSDLAAATTPKRIRLDPSLEGVEYILPTSPQWPHANPYIELTNSVGETIRMTVIYVRGPRLNAHRERSVTIAVNICGPDDVGDGTGDDIDRAFYQLQWLLNTHVLYNDGKGYRTGNWPGLVTYANGDAILQTSKFEAAQALSVTWMEGNMSYVGVNRGYKGHIALTEPTTLREVLRRFNMTFNSFIGANHFGQVFPVLIDDSATTAGPIYRDRMEIGGLDDMTYMHELVQTWVEYAYDWDPDAQKFRVEIEHTGRLDIEDAVKGRINGSFRSCFYTRDKATIDDSQARFLLLVKTPPRFATFWTDLSGTQTEIGDPFRLTHYDGAPDTATQMLTFKHRVAASGQTRVPPKIWLTGLDVTRLRDTAFAALQDEGTMVGNLGDETSALLPPTGAFELR